MTDLHWQAAMQMSKMLETKCSELEAYNYEIMAGLESDEEATYETMVFDEHQKAMEFIDLLGDLLSETQPSDRSPPSTNIRSVNRQLNFMEDSVQTIREQSKLLTLLTLMC